MENHSNLTGWQELFLLIFCGRCDRNMWLKIYRLSNFNTLYHLVLLKLLKSELFSCVRKVDHVINSCKGPIPIQPPKKGKGKARKASEKSGNYSENFLPTIPTHYKIKTERSPSKCKMAAEASLAGS